MTHRAIIVQPDEDALARVLVDDVLELMKMIVSGLFGLVAGIVIANNDRPEGP